MRKLCAWWRWRGEFELTIRDKVGIPGAEIRLLRPGMATLRRRLSIGGESLEDGSDFGDFVGAEEVGFAKRSQDGKERFGRSDFFTEIFKSVRQRVADRE